MAQTTRGGSARGPARTTGGLDISIQTRHELAALRRDLEALRVRAFDLDVARLRVGAAAELFAPEVDRALRRVASLAVMWTREEQLALLPEEDEE